MAKRKISKKIENEYLNGLNKIAPRTKLWKRDPEEDAEEGINEYVNNPKWRFKK